MLNFVKSVDIDMDGQIWVTLAFLVTYKLSGVYIPPENAPYFQHSHVGALASHTP